MNYLKSLKQRFNKDEFLVIFIILSLLLPAYICIPILLIETIYLLYTKRLISAFKNTDKVKYLIIFSILSLVVSLIYQNWIGVACTLFIMIAISLTLYYRQIITKDLFEFILDLVIAMSILWAIYGFYEYMMILNRFGIDHFKIKIYSRRENRLNSVFMNANYYAMMIEFTLMMIGYKLFGTKDIKKISYYLSVAFINCFLLFLSGCRTAWPAIGIGVIVFLIINKNYRWCLFIGTCFALGIIMIIINPSIFPRFSSILKYYSDRNEIWSTAIKGIKAHPLFGQGPMTYMMIYEKYQGYVTHHAHSIYLDPFLCFGVVGVGTIIPYIVNNCKELFYVYKNKLDRRLVAFILACVSAVLIHGILDYTVFWIHTGILFLFIASSFNIYTKKQKS